MHSKAHAAIAILAATTAANAGVNPIDNFAATATESFDAFSAEGSLPTSAFSGDAAISSDSGLLLRTDSWGFTGKGTTEAYSGDFFVGSTAGPAIYNFTNPIYAFAAYFSTNTDVPGATAEFFSAAGDLLASIPLTVPATTAEGSSSTDWAFNAFSSSDPITTVRITGNYNSGSNIMMDDIQISSTPLPTPGSLATLVFAGCTIVRCRRRA